MLKKWKILLLMPLLLILSGCESTLNGHTVTIAKSTDKPIKIDTYNNDGQKIDQLKTNKVKIKDDNELVPAVDLKYGDNKIIHTSSSLIAYEGMHNYMDDYRHLQSANQKQDTFADKSTPLMVQFDRYFRRKFDNQSKSVIVIKSQAGTPIAIFTGNQIQIKQVGTSDFPNSIITIDGRHLFVYDCSYTTYPISALNAMLKNNQASSKKRQANVITKQAPPVDTTKKRK